MQKFGFFEFNAILPFSDRLGTKNEIIEESIRLCGRLSSLKIIGRDVPP
jgi:hypothetical protein